MSAPLPTDWNFTPGNGQGGAPSSIAGALPGSGGGTLGNHAAATFYFSSMNPTILSSTVIGPRSIVYYRVSSGSSNGVLTTTLTNNLGASVATITWWDCPVLGIPAVGLRHKVRDWLQKSSDGRSRKMVLNDVQYRWIPNGERVYLTSNDGNTVHGCVTKSHNMVTVEMTQNATHLSEYAIIATLILQAGRNID